MKWRILLAMLCLLSLPSCEHGMGQELNRSLSGILPATDVAPRGQAYLLANYDYDTSPPTGIDYVLWPPFATFTILTEGTDFRIAPGAGSLDIPPQYIADSRSLYEVPGARGRYVLEFNQITGESRELRVTIVQRRCQGETCVLAIADGIPVGAGEGQVDVPPGVACEGAACLDAPRDAAAFAAAAQQVAERTTNRDLNRYYLIYRAAEP